MIAHSLRASGFDASEDGTGRGTPLLPVTVATLVSNGDAHSGYRDEHGLVPVVNAFDARQSDVIQYGDMTGPLDTDGHTMAVALRGREGGATAELSEVPSALRASGGGGDKAYVMAPTLTASSPQSSEGTTQQVAAVLSATMQVRRLTPKECARLQGFPNDYLDITYRNKPAADGPKYKALGNSMAVPVMRWIGKRIAQVAAIKAA